MSMHCRNVKQLLYVEISTFLEAEDQNLLMQELELRSLMFTTYCAIHAYILTSNPLQAAFLLDRLSFISSLTGAPFAESLDIGSNPVTNP